LNPENQTNQALVIGVPVESQESERNTTLSDQFIYNREVDTINTTLSDQFIYNREVDTINTTLSDQFIYNREVDTINTTDILLTCE
jgi:hypothetical protein